MKKHFFLVLAIMLLGLYAQAHVTLLNPSGGETVRPGETLNIQWEVAVPHNQENWDLYYSIDGGVTWDAIQLDMAIEVLNYEWVVPAKTTSSARIKIVMDNVLNNYDGISADFTIGEINLTSPIGGESYNPEESVTIDWFKPTSLTALSWDLFFSIDGGTIWDPIVTMLDPEVIDYLWIVPKAPTVDAKIKVVMNMSNAVLEDESGAFTINPVLTLDYPVGGEIFNPQDIVDVSWNSTIGLDGYNWDLMFSDDNGVTWDTILEDANATTLNYAWAVPDQATMQGKIKIVLDGVLEDYETTSSLFTITSLVELTNPVGGEIFEPDQTVSVSWEINVSEGMLNWDLYFSSDGGIIWESMAMDLPVEQLDYDWVVPEVLTQDGMVKIVMDNEDVDNEDISEAFTIAIVNNTAKTHNIESRIYPNPVHGLLTIEFDNHLQEPHQIAVIDITGKTRAVIENIVLGVTKIDVSRLKSGVYYYVLSSDKKVSSAKFLVK